MSEMSLHAAHLAQELAQFRTRVNSLVRKEDGRDAFRLLYDADQGITLAIRSLKSLSELDFDATEV